MADGRLKGAGAAGSGNIEREETRFLRFFCTSTAWN